jgi:RNA polymerase sigma factor (sigma-70 family)
MDRSLDGAVGRLLRAAAVQTLGRLTDRALLERFAGAHDEAAFTVLIERHGPMVYGVCRRALSSHHDAEDACQATFLVLARNAGALRKKESLGSFLHGVARRVATSLKRQAVRRKNRESRSTPPAPAEPSTEVTWREVQAVLDEELARLPERYRAPLILCYLEGLTRDEAAARLGLSSGGLHGRLERGRELLRKRLNGRGLGLPAALSATLLAAGVSRALSPVFIVSSTRAAVLFAARQPLMESARANALSLAQEVLQNMTLAKVKAGAGVLCAVLLALAGGSFVSLGNAQGPRPKAQTVAARVESDRDFICRLSKDLRDSEPTPAEVHFFVANKDPGKRQKLIDLFIQERQARKAATANANKSDERAALVSGWPLYADPYGNLTQAQVLAFTHSPVNANANQNYLLWSASVLRPNPGALWAANMNPYPVWNLNTLCDQVNFTTLYNSVLAPHQKQGEPARLAALQKEFYKELRTAKDKSDVARITQAYLDRLIGFLKEHPTSREGPDAIRQIVLLYEAQGKSVEADAWRAKLPKETTGGAIPVAPKKP